MKPERIEELAREATTWAGGDDFGPVSIAIRTAIREFAEEAVARARYDDPCADMIERLRDEVLGEEKAK